MTTPYSITDNALAVDNMCLALAKDHLAFEKRILEAEKKYHEILQNDMLLQLELLKEENEELTEENKDLYQTTTEMEHEITDLMEMVDDLLED